MEAEALGHLDLAWQRLVDATLLLPRSLTYVEGRTGVRLARCPQVSGPDDEQLLLRMTRIVWREQTELTDLRNRFAADGVRAREVLVEAAVLYAAWIEFDDYAYYPLTADPELVNGDPTSVDRSRGDLLDRATLLRQFVNPLAGRVTTPVWHNLGKWRGLRAAANRSLGQRPTPSPCSASGVPIREALLEAWYAARRWLRSHGELVIAPIR